MTDKLDQAKDLEVLHRQMALTAQKNASKETDQPDEINGVRFCLDCGDKISQERLDARPESVRCVDCKSYQEKKEARHVA